jgi:hypothetical protein
MKELESGTEEKSCVVVFTKKKIIVTLKEYKITLICGNI